MTWEAGQWLLQEAGLSRSKYGKRSDVGAARGSVG